MTGDKRPEGKLGFPSRGTAGPSEPDGLISITGLCRRGWQNLFTAGAADSGLGRFWHELLKKIGTS